MSSTNDSEKSQPGCDTEDQNTHVTAVALTFITHPQMQVELAKSLVKGHEQEQFFLVSQINSTKLLTIFNKALTLSSHLTLSPLRGRCNPRQSQIPLLPRHLHWRGGTQLMHLNPCHHLHSLSGGNNSYQILHENVRLCIRCLNGSYSQA